MNVKEIAERFNQPMRKQFIISCNGVKLRAKFSNKGLVICSKDGEFVSEQWLNFLLKGKAKIVS